MDRLGVMFFCDQLDREELVHFAQRIEALGYQTLWLPELFGREAFSSAAYLLAKTQTLHVATGIANVYARDALSAAQARSTLGELSQGRFILGLGVSNPQILKARGQQWQPPVQKLRTYLQELNDAQINAPAPKTPAPVYVAAHGPKLLRLSSAAADGANTYLMPVAHTREARDQLGSRGVLNVVQHCLLVDDANTARNLARRAVGRYCRLDYYQRTWSRFGFGANDFVDGGSDRLLDTLVAWGDVATIKTRLEAHRAAGANEVVVVPLNPEGGGVQPHWPLLEALAAVS